MACWKEVGAVKTALKGKLDLRAVEMATQACEMSAHLFRSQSSKNEAKVDAHL